MKQRENIMLAVMFGLLAIVALWTHGQMSKARSAAEITSDDVQICQKLISTMKKSAHRPTMASDHEKLNTETNSFIERAASEAKIDSKSLIRITPEPARRMGDTAYKEKPTMIFLKNITLEQLVSLSHGLQTAEQQLAPKFIRIVAPQQNDTSLKWNAEVSVTYLIYAPPSSQTNVGRTAR